MIKIEFIGHLGADCTIRVHGNQNAITFPVGVTERWQNAKGESCEKLIWLNCTLWRPMDKSRIMNFLLKGQMVFVEGEPSVKYWNRKSDNAAQGSLEVRAAKVELLSKLKPIEP